MSWDPDQPEGQPPEEPDSNNEERPEQDTPPNSFGQPAQDLPVRNYYEQPSGRGYVPPQATPLPLSQAIQNLPNQYIKILTRPGVQAFAEEQGKAEWGIIWIQLLIMGLIGTLVGIFQTVLLHASLLPNLAQKGPVSGYSSMLYQMVFSGGTTVFAAIAIIAGFFLTNGVQFLLAKAFGGSGDFKTQGYNYLLFAVPLTLISSILGLIPILSVFISFGVVVYQVVLNVFSIAAAHRLSGGKATAVVLIPVGAIIVLILLCSLAAAAVLYTSFYR